jgi:hypothetical protein
MISESLYYGKAVWSDYPGSMAFSSVQGDGEEPSGVGLRLLGYGFTHNLRPCRNVLSLTTAYH